MVNPMRINWEEMPKYVEWCSENHYHLWFNTIWRPRHLAIWTLPSQKISEILDYYRNYNFNPPNDLKCRDFFEANLWAFKSFAFNQVQGWLKDQIEREDSKTDFNSILKSMEGSKEIFSQRHVYLENSKYFEKLEILTSKVLSQDRLYFYLNKQSEFTLKAKMQDPNQNQVLEWVYQICDYY
jgi:hypothetical protein